MDSLSKKLLTDIAKLQELVNYDPSVFSSFELEVIGRMKKNLIALILKEEKQNTRVENFLTFRSMKDNVKTYEDFDCPYTEDLARGMNFIKQEQNV